MSQQGWRQFLAAADVDDWVVLHGGATAVFGVRSLTDVARLAQALTQIPGLDGSRALLTIADDRVTVRLARGMFQLEERHISLARTVSTVARATGAVPDRAAVQEVQVAVAAQPDALDVEFWRAVLGYRPLDDDNAIDPLGHSSTVWLQELTPDKPLRHAMHLDVSLAREQRPESRRRLPRAAAWWTRPTLRPAGSWQTGPVTRCASHRGRTAASSREPDPLGCQP
ncbi:MAG: hypothetical protein QOE23_2324 [Pseudonocardiales bacterium]|jgi:4a-hydroxytetrahydrobiopterin dehydratase|nr:hypothetical protein [Pseudonocardiales bacterium]